MESMESMKNTLQPAPPDKIFLAYVNRKPLDNMDMRWGKQVLAGASFSENEVLDWIEKGKQVEHDIWYEELILENPHEVSGTPKEVFVYFSGITCEGWEEDFEWMDPVGRRATIPMNYVGVPRPWPAQAETGDEYGGIVWNRQDLHLWRVPCPWMSAYLLAPFPHASSPDINYGKPWTV